MGGKASLLAEVRPLSRVHRCKGRDVLQLHGEGRGTAAATTTVHVVDRVFGVLLSPVPARGRGYPPCGVGRITHDYKARPTHAVRNGVQGQM